MTAPSATPTVRCLNVNEVAAKLGSSDQFVWIKVRTDPTFPRPLKTGPKSTRWLEHQLDAWLLAQLEGATHA